MTLSQILAQLAEQQAKVASFAHVEFEDDPNTPGKRGYSIGGSTAEVVQEEIDKHMRVVEATGGVGEFLNPLSLSAAKRRYGDLFMDAPFVSLGYTIIKEAK